MRSPALPARLHSLGALLSLMLCAACSAPAPEAEQAHEYAKQLSPLLYENSLLAQQLYDAASDIGRGEEDAVSLEATWTQRITPLAEHLADQAEVVKAPSDWVDRHDELVAIWTVRARSYRALSTALTLGDESGWRESRKQSDDSKVREERWFIETNRAMEPLGVVLDQLP